MMDAKEFRRRFDSALRDEQVDLRALGRTLDVADIMEVFDRVMSEAGGVQSEVEALRYALQRAEYEVKMLTLLRPEYVDLRRVAAKLDAELTEHGILERLT